LLIDRMKYFLFFGLFCNFFLTSSCKKYKPAPAAFFIKTEKVSVATTTAQGTSNHKITDLYLYINGEFKGAFQSGNTLPIVTNNSNVTVDIFAGIKEDGIKDKSVTWPFYDKIEFDTLVESGKTILRPLTFKYNPGTTFAWLENFDGTNGISLIKSILNGGSLAATFTTASQADSFEGKSYELNLNNLSVGSVGTLESSLSYALPQGNPNVYLELNYKCSSVFEVGLSDGLVTKPTMYINPQANWNKIYIKLAETVNLPPNPGSQKVYFRVLKTNDNPDPHVWLDNIKLIYL
jgi:hypothetical protein